MMGDVMRKTNPDSFFVAFLVDSDEDEGYIVYTYDCGNNVNSRGAACSQGGKVIEIFGPEPFYYGRKITVLQVQRIRNDGETKGMWIAEVIYKDNSKPGSFNLPDAE